MLEPPIVVVVSMPGPSFGRRAAFEDLWKSKPDQSTRRLASARITFVLRRHFDFRKLTTMNKATGVFVMGVGVVYIFLGSESAREGAKPSALLSERAAVTADGLDNDAAELLGIKIPNIVQEVSHQEIR